MMHTNGLSTSTQAICISKLACSFYGTMANLLECLISKMPQCRKTFILSSTRTPVWGLLRAHNGVSRQVPLQGSMDPAQRRMALHPIGVDVWQISPMLNLSLRPKPLVCTISASLLDRHRHKGKAARVKIRLGSTKSSTDIRQYDEPRHRPISIITGHSHFQHPSLYPSHNYLCLDRRPLIAFPIRIMELQTLA